MENKIRIILTSTSSEENAKEIAKSLVESGLAACVQISAPGVSIYRWEDAIQQEQEYYLSIKTTVKASADVVTWLEQHHPYETSEIVCLKGNSSTAYMQWLRESVQ